MIATTQLDERYNTDGTISARGVGVRITPQDGRYMVRTRIPGGSRHGTRYYACVTYEDALDRALIWHTRTLPRR